MTQIVRKWTRKLSSSLPDLKVTHTQINDADKRRQDHITMEPRFPRATTPTKITDVDIEGSPFRRNPKRTAKSIPHNRIAKKSPFPDSECGRMANLFP